MYEFAVAMAYVMGGAACCFLAVLVAVTVGGIVLGATLVLSLIPMRRATKLSIADTLR